MAIRDFLDEPPAAAQLTDYDRTQLKTYLRLLDAEAEGAAWEEVTQIIFGLDPEAEPERAKKIYSGHLARAHWMTEHGYQDLLRAE
jgi:hypothetical protein